MPGMQMFTAQHLDQLDPMGFVIEDKGVVANGALPDQENGHDIVTRGSIPAQVGLIQAHLQDPTLYTTCFSA